MLESEALRNQPIIITGMHRSGTSLTASILQKAGVNLGDELLGSIIGSNILGHFEDTDFLSLHQEILISQGISSEGWTTLSKVNVPEQLADKAKFLLDRRSQQPGLWGWKDPRTVLFLDFWHGLLPEAKFIFVYRTPWEVADSLFTRGDLAFINNPKLAIEAWLAYNTTILDFYNYHSDRSVLLHIDNLCGTENTLISTIKQKLNVNLSPLEENLFQDNQMHREINKTHRPCLLAKHYPKALELYQRLESAADLPACDKVFEETNAHLVESYRDWIFQDWLTSKRCTVSKHRTQAELQRTQAELQRTQAELQRTQAELQRTQAESRRLQAHIQAMEASKFWKARQVWLELKRSVSRQNDK